MHDKELKLSNIWRTCNKIRAAVFRVRLNLWDYYLPLDPNRNCLISESQFVSVLTGPLKSYIGLSEQEICELADYFRVQDGRILYSQLCEVIHKSVPSFSKNAPMTTGLEWEDPLQVNRLSPQELRRLRIIITKIACTVNIRNLVLRPYFQDYELISKNTGTVTITHFARVLAYLGITLGTEEFQLLLKRFLKDSYTVNYVAFVATIEEVVNFMNKYKMLDLGGDLLGQFPERIITAELPKLPRPEVGTKLLSDLTGKQDNFHPALKGPPKKENLVTILRRIQRYIMENKVAAEQFFRGFDTYNSGRITVSQFERGLDALGVSSMGRLYLCSEDIKLIIIQYRDPIDPQRVFWRTFISDINMATMRHCLEKHPTYNPEIPPKEVVELPRKGADDWQSVNPSHRDLCEEAMEKIKTDINKRRIILKQVFRDFDRLSCGHISRSQMRRCFVMHNILLSDEELYALEKRYNDDMGFNYLWFMKELYAKPQMPTLYERFLEEAKKINASKRKKPPEAKEKDIVVILAKIKAQVVREGIHVLQFFKDFDRHNHYCITRNNFHRGIDLCKLILNENEVETLMEVFASPMREEYVDYRRFCAVVEEAVSQTGLERAPLIVPIQHLPSKDCDRNFLNFEERQAVSLALQKISKAPEPVLNLRELYRDFDKTKRGIIRSDQIMKGLSIRGLHNLISSKEFNALCKSFTCQQVGQDGIDYRSLCRAIDIVYSASRQY